jgi:sec-independent protein translocase protein TatA
MVVLNTLLLLNLGTMEIVLIVVVVLLLFGGKKIPELMRGIGKGVQSFKKGLNEVETQEDKTTPTDSDNSK